jgi:homoserine kinase type II
MAVKTSFTPDDFIELLTQYNMGDYASFKPFVQGTDQTNLLLATTRREVVLRYYEKRTVDYASFEIELLHYLGENSYPCAVPIAKKDGGFIGTYRKKPFVLFELLPGEHSDDLENYLQVAEIIAKLHALTLGFRPNDGLSRPTYSPEYCWSCAQKSAKRMKLGIAALERMGWMKKELDSLELPDCLPRGTCHGDLNPSNFLYEGGKLSGVLDFDQASYTWLLYDVGQLIYWWTWPNTDDIDFDRSRKLIGHYEEQRPMATDERLYLFDALKLVFLIGIGWFLDDDEGYANARRKVALLNSFGRHGFHRALF